MTVTMEVPKLTRPLRSVHGARGTLLLLAFSDSFDPRSLTSGPWAPCQHLGSTREGVDT
jgi:hypothetical protein